eukprot:GGOE01065041.1.p1 GENE.GGOE01065041.1~~GGOE01065041.1.p1  ORF type:complete len:176 (-),score=24.13 GGOE01065041.1:90-617(-)
MSTVLSVLGKRFQKAALVPKMNPFMRIRCHGFVEEFQRGFLGELHAFALPGACMTVACALGFFFIARSVYTNPELSLAKVVPEILQPFTHPNAQLKAGGGKDDDDSQIPKQWGMWARHPNYGVLHTPFLDLLNKEAKARGKDGVNMGAEYNLVFTKSMADQVVDVILQDIQKRVA